MTWSGAVRRALIGAVVMVGLVVAGVFVDRGDAPGRADAAASPIERGRQVADELLIDWRTWRTATLGFVETSTRRAPTGELVSRVEVVQRFPDLVVDDGGNVSARLDGRLLGCTVAADGSRTCVDNGGYRPHEELELELDALRALVDGPGATYDVSRSEGCYRLVHVGADRFPSRGDRQTLCFDERTGTLVEEVQVSGDVTVDVHRTEVSTTVDPSRFALQTEPPAG